MLKFWLTLENSSGAVVGQPITTATEFVYTQRMSRAGEFSFSMPAEDSQASNIAERLIVRCYAIVNNAVTEIGAGIIDNITRSAAQDGRVMVSVSGSDLLRELTYRQVGSLAIDDGAGGATTNGVSLIMAKAPAGWTASGTSAVSLLHAFEGETVLGALVRLTEITGEAFRLGSGRTVEWITSDIDSGVVLLYGLGVARSEKIGTITNLTVERDTYGVISRVYPHGVGTGDLQLTLDGTAFVPPSGYTINTAENYIAISPEAVRIDEYISLKDIQNADTLAQAAFTYLSQRADAATFYSAECLLDGALPPGKTARLVARKIVDGVRAIDVDATLTIIETTMRIDAGGLRTVAVKLSNARRYPDDDAQGIVSAGSTSRDAYTYPQPGPAANIDTGTVGRLAKYKTADKIGQSYIADGRSALLTLSGASATEVEFESSDNEDVLAYNSTLAKWRARAQDNLALVGDMLYLQATTAAGADLALGITPTPVSVTIYNPTYATDNDDSTYAYTNASSVWQNKGYVFDLGAEYWVWGIRSRSTTHTGAVLPAYTVDYGNDGTTWTTVMTITPLGIDETHALSAPIKARYWRFRGLTGATGSFTQWRAYTLSIFKLSHSSFVRERLGIGSAGQLLGVSGGLPAWVDSPIGVSGIVGRLLKYTLSGAASNGAIVDAIGGGTLTLSSAFSTNRSLTIPDETGTLALLERAQTFAAAQAIHGSNDAVQLVVRANATQTNNIAEFQSSGGAAKLSVEPDGDLKFIDAASGVVLKDRTTGTYYRLYIDSGALSIESV